ncbi:hypothetical protein [Candidatus Lucifugimonas marina]|jgi:hypothetical protein
MADRIAPSEAARTDEHTMVLLGVTAHRRETLDSSVIRAIKPQ